MLRLKTLFAASLPSLLVSTALAQAPLGPGPAAISGLAVDDLLNIRAEASPLGKVITRMPNGSLVELFECRMFNGYEWCRLTPAENPEVSGWAPARYLLALEIPGSENTEETQSGSEPLTDGATDRVQAAGESMLPLGLEERFSSEPNTPGGWSEQDVAAVQQLADRLRPPDAAPLPSTVAAVPIPAPREGGTDDDSASSYSPPVEAPTDVPCARYTGQPMQSCAVTVAKIDDANSDVAVFFPDGGFRLIEFREGKPTGSNGEADLRATREGTLNIIRIGKSERFEILDVVPYGG
ncbi:SH3 domain-containing protein [Aquamicrobium zhengzhouense]|uniref:SH3 domain-containing protein n=1 Tax=Aquamicrobium zhengzhouense TaxID=2781738 RepID=A0ABS0S960_9HYPH|nr:SH3 domain-containing protein [Aquamicrobium zhengzhouense]MBI1619830.1 SH3 domain-containing protein [Aquamicrobium zhengzhouense]